MATIAMNAAVTGAQAQQFRVNTISNNVANISTDGFKRNEVIFSDLFYLNAKKAGVIENTEASERPTNIQTGTGTKVIGTYRNLEQGTPRQTFAPLDVAITGGGYFAVQMPNNRIGYTRAGSFQKDRNNNLTTINGLQLENPITISDEIPTESINISESGAITAPDPQDPTQNIELGQLELFTFANERGLEAIGNNLLIETAGSGERIQIEGDALNGRFKQGFLEGSNVNSVIELTQLVEAERYFELNNRVINTQGKMMDSTNKVQ